MDLPTGEVQKYEVLEWAQEQAQFLTPTQTLVLWYLCINAWNSPSNREGAPAGQVLSGRTALRKIRMRTGLSDRAVRDALHHLQDAGYIWRESKHGNGQSKIVVFWIESADEMRAEVRAGVREIPEGMRRKPKKRATPVVRGNIIEFPFRRETPQ
jgi:DNA-binding MarR family transcriptional regulator